MNHLLTLKDAPKNKTFFDKAKSGFGNLFLNKDPISQAQCSSKKAMQGTINQLPAVILQGRTAILVIDMQRRFVYKLGIGYRDRFIENNVAFLTEAGKLNNVKFFMLELHNKEDKWSNTIEPIHNILIKQNAYRINKEFDNGFNGTPLAPLLLGENIQTIVLCGLNAGACVYQTAVGAIYRGFQIITAEDIISTGISTYYSTGHKLDMSWYKKHGRLFKSHTDILELLKVNQK